MNKFNGVEVTTSRYLTVAGPPRVVRRSWRERLFSHPWKPWQATYLQGTTLPDPKVYQTARGFLMHPATYAKLKEQVAHD